MLLKETLLKLTVDEIRSIANEWGISGLSRLNKADLVDVVNDFMLDDNNLREMLLRFEPDELKTLQNSKGPCIKPGRFINSSIAFLSSVGLIRITTGGQYAVPEDISEKLSLTETQSFKDENERINLIRNYIVAFVELYGLIPAEKAVEIYKMQTGDELTAQELLNTVDDRYRPVQFAVVYKNCLAHESLWAVCDDDSDCEELEKEQKDKPFYIPEKDELLKYADIYSINLAPAGMALATFLLRHNRLDEETAQDIVFDIQTLINSESNLMMILKEMARMGVVIKHPKQFKEFTLYLKNLARTTRLWSLCGHTADELDVKTPLELELENYSFANTTKVGRNEPCPCGSGKKYKKCCGK